MTHLHMSDEGAFEIMREAQKLCAQKHAALAKKKDLSAKPADDVITLIGGTVLRLH